MAAVGTAHPVRSCGQSAMQAIIIASYLTAAAAFLCGALWLTLAWRGQRTGGLLIIAMTVTLAWGAFGAYAAWLHQVTINWLLLAEALRYGGWLWFLGALGAGWRHAGPLGGLRMAVQVLWAALAVYCLLPGLGLPAALALPFDTDVAVGGVLLLALAGVVLLEQLYRGVATEQRWALKFLVAALGLMFVYDIFLYSYALLYRQLSSDAWAARGFVDALAVPLLLVAAARNRDWSLVVGVSRRAVFYSTSLLVVAAYILATALGGYYVREYGGNWGRVAEITLVCLAILGALVLLLSGQARSRARIFMHRHFFRLRHDYREEWLRLTAALAHGEAGLRQRALRALADLMDSPAGALFMRDEAALFTCAVQWNLAPAAALRLPAGQPSFEFMRARQWVYVLDAQPPHADPALRAPAELAGLARAWLLVPLVLAGRLHGFAVLTQARAPRALDWEDIDLLRAASSQIAATLAQADDARRLAEARQFEGFNRLTAFLMHDLKNVAAQQSLLLQNAERHKHNPAFIDDMLATVANSVQRIQRLLEQLRGDRPDVPAARVRVAAVVERALAECRAQQPVPQCAAIPDDLWLRADSEQLALALAHVIRNAQDAAGADGHVRLTVVHGGTQAVIAVEDDGAGMDEAFIRERLFQPFFTTKASKGMGVGAYQARACARALGGSLEVQSTPGTGTVFTFRLPLLVAAGDAAADAAAGTAA